MGRRRSGRRGGGSTDQQKSSPSSSGGSTDQQKSSPSSSGGSTDQRRCGGEEETPSPPRQIPAPDTRALRRRLLALIRGLYLDAISRLPTAELRATLARGLLVGGHCYGPLHPLHNIIANSVWYAAAFPPRPADRVEVDVLCTQGTDRAVRRSLDGLVACLLHICRFLSPADALWLLYRSRADLRVAVASARSPSARCAKPSLRLAAAPELAKAAFQVAAETARHPSPAAFALFASSVLPDVERHVSRLLVSNRGLSSSDIDRLSSVLLPHPLPDQLLSSSPPDPSPVICQLISEKKRCATRWHEGLLQIADAALCKFTRQTGVRCELHTIYGESLVDDDDYNEYFHINFMGQPKQDPPSSASDLGLGHRLFFFAEAPRPPRQDFREEDISVCCLVQPSPGDTDNCHACLMNKYRINHPTVEPDDRTCVLQFGGQCYETGTIDHDWDLRPTLGVDYMFFDSDRDNGLVGHLLSQFARIHAYCSNMSDYYENNGPPVGSYCRYLV